MSHRHHVLLVEDDDDTREALEMALGLLGVRVSAVETALDGLAALRRGVDCCVVLLDWRMPKMDGEAFVRARAEETATADTPIVAVTGDGLQSDLAATLGIREVVRKPADPGAVLAAVERQCRDQRPR